MESIGIDISWFSVACKSCDDFKTQKKVFFHSSPNFFIGQKTQGQEKGS